MTAPLDRARQLITLAVDEGTTLEEARTAALTAARLIARHQLLDRSPGREERYEPAPRPRTPPTVTAATEAGICWLCRLPYRVGMPLLRVEGREAVHAECGEEDGTWGA